MAYSIRVETVGEAGTPRGDAALFEAPTENEAVTIAADEIDAHRPGPQRLAAVFDASGLLVLTYVGCARVAGHATAACDDER